MKPLFKNETAFNAIKEKNMNLICGNEMQLNNKTMNYLITDCHFPYIFLVFSIKFETLN